MEITEQLPAEVRSKLVTLKLGQSDYTLEWRYASDGYIEGIEVTDLVSATVQRQLRDSRNDDDLW